MLAAEPDELPRPTSVSAAAIHGYVDILDGRRESGLSRIQAALDETRAADHAPGMRATLVRTLLEACAVTENLRIGLAAADAALASGDAARLWEAETRRRRAEFLAALGAPAEEINAEFKRSLDVARRQGAPMLELRTAASLLRYRLERGDQATDQAREHLAVIVAALPEGRETQDLRDAVLLLDR
jgi:hypothetical protein